MRACIHGDVCVSWSRSGRGDCPLCLALRTIGKIKSGKRVKATDGDTTENTLFDGQIRSSPDPKES